MPDDSQIHPVDAKSMWKYLRSMIGWVGADNLARPVSTDYPLPVQVIGGGAGGGGGTDPSSAREATQIEMRDALTSLLALLGNTDGLEALAGQTNALLTTLNTYNDGVESLLGSLGSNTDGLEGLLTSLGVKEDSTIAKLEAVRALLADGLTVNTGLTGLASQATLAAVLAALQGTVKTAEQLVAPGTLTGDIPAGSSTGAAMNAAGLSGVRLLIGASWTAADLSFETSADGVTWLPLHDNYGSLIRYKVAANRAINIPVGDLLRVNQVRVRSGVPGAYVNQVALAGVTLVTAGL